MTRYWRLDLNMGLWMIFLLDCTHLKNYTGNDKYIIQEQSIFPTKSSTTNTSENRTNRSTKCPKCLSHWNRLERILYFFLKFRYRPTSKSVYGLLSSPVVNLYGRSSFEFIWMFSKLTWREFIRPSPYPYWKADPKIDYGLYTGLHIKLYTLVLIERH